MSQLKRIIFVGIATIILFISTVLLLQSCSKDDSSSITTANSNTSIATSRLEIISEDATFRNYCTDLNEIIVAVRNLSDDEQITLKKINIELINKDSSNLKTANEILRKLKTRIGYDVRDKITHLIKVNRELDQKFNFKKLEENEYGKLIALSINKNLFFNKYALFSDPILFLKSYKTGINTVRFKTNAAEQAACKDACQSSYDSDIRTCGIKDLKEIGTATLGGAITGGGAGAVIGFGIGTIGGAIDFVICIKDAEDDYKKCVNDCSK